MSDWWQHALVLSVVAGCLVYLLARKRKKKSPPAGRVSIDRLKRS